MAKKVLFVFPSFGIGGTTVSTRSLISLLEKEGYDCWVMPLVPQGKMIHLYDDVKRIETPFVVRALSMGGCKEEPSILKRPLVALLRFIRNHSMRFEHRMVGRALDKIIGQHHFDTVVACQEAVTTRFVSHASLGNKVAWVRCDYKRMLEDSHKSKEDFYGSYKAIVCVSDQTCANFKAIFPEYAAKTHCIPNPQDSGFITHRADEIEEEPRFATEGKVLVSIGRFDPVKRFDQVALIARQLLDKGLKFKWYLIGDGAERPRIEASIKEYHVEDRVILLGVKTNPYYYIKRADAMVCLSRSEACPRVVNEAKILHAPTISTDFPTIYEFIENDKTGLISSLENLPATILRFFSDNDLRLKIKENIELFDFDNKELINAIKTIL